jgi:hypothetical protein
MIAPPATPAAAAVRIAIGLTALFALCPATRWGYFIYPLALVAWAWLERSRRGALEAGGRRERVWREGAPVGAIEKARAVEEVRATVQACAAAEPAATRG